jgi:cell division protease FtsH
MGHAIVAAATPGADAVHKVSIIPRGIGALGFTMQRPTDDRYLMTREELEGKLTVLLGGRAAEQIVFGHLSTGAADDLARASDIARNMVARYAMVPELGNATFVDEPGFVPTGVGRREYSEATAREIDVAVRQLVDGAFDRALAVLQRNATVLREAAERLLTLETLDEEALRPFLEKVVPP